MWNLPSNRDTRLLWTHFSKIRSKLEKFGTNLFDISGGLKRVLRQKRATTLRVGGDCTVTAGPKTPQDFIGSSKGIYFEEPRTYASAMLVVPIDATLKISGAILPSDTYPSADFSTRSRGPIEGTCLDILNDGLIYTERGPIYMPNSTSEIGSLRIRGNGAAGEVQIWQRVRFEGGTFICNASTWNWDKPFNAGPYGDKIQQRLDIAIPDGQELYATVSDSKDGGDAFLPDENELATDPHWCVRYPYFEIAAVRPYQSNLNWNNVKNGDTIRLSKMFPVKSKFRRAYQS